MDPVLAWIDLESTGFSPRDGESLLQLAVIITDKDFNELGELETKFYYTEDEVREFQAKASDFVKEMHTKTGLWDQLTTVTNPSFEEFDTRLLAWLKVFEPEAGKLAFAGNSIFLDREFMREFLPQSYEHLAYRSLDMTSIELFYVHTEGRPRYQKRLAHEALDDIRESLEQARYHRALNKPF